MDLNVSLILLTAIVIAAVAFLITRAFAPSIAKKERGRSNELVPSTALSAPPDQATAPTEGPLPSEFVLALDGPKPDGPEYLVRVLDEPSRPLGRSGTTQSGPLQTALSTLGLAPGRLVAAVPVLSQALRGGKVVEIVGPPNVIEGLRNGSMVFMQKDGNSLGTVVWRDGGKISGQAQFRGVRTFVSPAIAFQLLAIATSQYYLVQINGQLEKVLKGVEEILERMRSEAWGKLRGAQRTLEEVAMQMDVLAGDSSEFWPRLAAAEQSINAIIGESERNLRLYCDRVHQLAGANADRNKIGEVLESKDDLVADAAMYHAAVRSRMAWFRLAIVHDFLANPDLAEVRRKQMIASVQQFNTIQDQVKCTAAELYGLAEMSVTPNGSVEKAFDYIVRWLEQEGDDMPTVTKDNEEFLSSFREFATGLQESSAVQLAPPDSRRVLVYQFHEGKDGQVEWGISEEGMVEDSQPHGEH